MKNKPPSAQSHATDADIEAAIAALTHAELERIGAFADFRARALAARGAGISSDDLVQEAITRTVEGRRRWPKSVTFVAYLMRVIESISHAAAKKTKGNKVAAADPDEDEVSDALATKLAPEQRHQAVVLAEVERIEKLFANDERVLLVIEGIKDGMSGPAIQEALNLTKTEYETAMKRLRRGARRKE